MTSSVNFSTPKNLKQTVPSTLNEDDEFLDSFSPNARSNLLTFPKSISAPLAEEVCVETRSSKITSLAAASFPQLPLYPTHLKNGEYASISPLGRSAAPVIPTKQTMTLFDPNYLALSQRYSQRMYERMFPKSTFINPHVGFTAPLMPVIQSTNIIYYNLIALLNQPTANQLSSVQQPAVYPTHLKNWFLTASALPQNSNLHSRLAHEQWSLAPDQNCETPYCQIPHSSSGLDIFVKTKNDGKDPIAAQATLEASPKKSEKVIITDYEVLKKAFAEALHTSFNARRTICEKYQLDFDNFNQYFLAFRKYYRLKNENVDVETAFNQTIMSYFNVNEGFFRNLIKDFPQEKKLNPKKRKLT